MIFYILVWIYSTEINRSTDFCVASFSRLDIFCGKRHKKYKHIGSLSLNEMNELYLTYTKFNPKIWRIIYTTSWIERLNKEFRRTFKIRNSMPSFESALTLLSRVAMDKEEGYFKYPIYDFKLDN